MSLRLSWDLVEVIVVVVQVVVLLVGKGWRSCCCFGVLRQ